MNRNKDTFDFHWKIMTAIHRVKEQTEQQSQPFCAQHNITHLQLRILLTLHFEGAHTVSALARQTCMAGANNSALCKKMERQGYVLRRRDKADERQVVVSLSPQGKRLVEAFVQQKAAQYQILAKNISTQDAHVILEGLDRLTNILEQNEEIAQ